MYFTIEIAECGCGNNNIECFNWYNIVDSKVVFDYSECYECDLDTDPRGANSLEEITEWAARGEGTNKVIRL